MFLFFSARPTASPHQVLYSTTAVPTLLGQSVTPTFSLVPLVLLSSLCQLFCLRPFRVILMDDWLCLNDSTLRGTRLVSSHTLYAVFIGGGFHSSGMHATFYRLAAPSYQTDLGFVQLNEIGSWKESSFYSYWSNSADQEFDFYPITHKCT